MPLPKDAVRLRIFLGADDRTNGRPLYEALVLKPREMHLAGATVLRGPLGFRHSSRLHMAKIMRLSDDLPMVVEIVDEEDKLVRITPKGEGHYEDIRGRIAAFCDVMARDMDEGELKTTARVLARIRETLAAQSILPVCEAWKRAHEDG
jgi:PII-like signaling protein